jgi:CDP-diacylglycerol pyrophosphatase
MGVNIREVNYRYYDLTGRRLADFIRLQYSASDIPVKEISLKSINDLEIYLSVNHYYARNSLKNLHHIICIAIDGKLIAKNPFYRLNVQYINADRNHLTQEEINTLAGLQFEKAELEQARDVFRFAVLRDLHRQT